MSEEQMVDLVQGALTARGITDEVLAAGQFNPRGHTGGMFAGGLAGSEAGGLLGEVGEAVGLEAGSVAGMRAADARSGLPASMLIGVSATMVYGFAAATRHSEPDSLVFQIPRAGLTVKVHQRVNVRVLELIDNASDARIELEGNRLPLTHSKDVIHILGSAGPGHQPGGWLNLTRACPNTTCRALTAEAGHRPGMCGKRHDQRFGCRCRSGSGM